MVQAALVWHRRHWCGTGGTGVAQAALVWHSWAQAALIGTYGHRWHLWAQVALMGTGGTDVAVLWH